VLHGLTTHTTVTRVPTRPTRFWVSIVLAECLIANGGVLNNHLTDLTSYAGGRITVDIGGTLNADSQSEGVALDLQGSLLVNNGTVTGTTNVYYGATVMGSGSFGQLNVFAGGTLALTPSAGTTAGSLVLTNGILSGGRESVLSATLHGTSQVEAELATPLVLSGSLTGDGSLTKTGSGTLVLAGSNTYAGGTVIETGTLQVSNVQSLLDGTSLTVGANATFTFGGVAMLAGSSAVPEPSTLTLLGVGGGVLLGLGLRRRRISLPWNESITSSRGEASEARRHDHLGANQERCRNCQGT
jgi:autotransporter-associated beta strand protein